MNVGFIGIGGMGLGMVRNLLKAGHAVTVYNRTRSRAEELLPDGATLADRPSDTCRGDAVISMLADDRAVEQLILESDFLAALAPGVVHCGMATISAGLAARLVEVHATAGRAYCSAPVFGRPPAAAAAQLFIVAAGAPAALAKCQPLFDVLGQRTFIVGEDPVAANVIKISGNFMLASLIETMGEAFALVRKYGIDPAQYLEVMTNSIFPAPVYKGYGGMIASDRFEPAGFKLALGLKDIRLALAAADAVTMPMPIASLVRDHYMTAMARGYGNIDWAGLALISAEAAALPRRSEGGL